MSYFFPSFYIFLYVAFTTMWKNIKLPAATRYKYMKKLVSLAASGFPIQNTKFESSNVTYKLLCMIFKNFRKLL